jgi:hypothetical protein
VQQVDFNCASRYHIVGTENLKQREVKSENKKTISVKNQGQGQGQGRRAEGVLEMRKGHGAWTEGPPTPKMKRIGVGEESWEEALVQYEELPKPARRLRSRVILMALGLCFLILVLVLVAAVLLKEPGVVTRVLDVTQPIVSMIVGWALGASRWMWPPDPPSEH